MGRRGNPDYDYLPTLAGDQQRASDPGEQVWLSAAAGTGKTQVLSARVLRLLLGGVGPEAILCLTFTKAGASEMANRLNGRLARWVMASEADLFDDLEALGEEAGPEARARARTLFARLLDARGGGLRIQTIHSFCQSLLASFPVEAGLAPGFRLIEDRDADILLGRVFGEWMGEAERQSSTDLIDAVGAMGIDLGETGAMNFLRRCARRSQSLRTLPEGQEGMTRWVHQALSGGFDNIWDVARELCVLAPEASLRTYAEKCEEWGTATGLKLAPLVRSWLAADSEERLRTYIEAEQGWLTGKRTPRALGKKGPSLEAAELAIMLQDWSDRLYGLIRLAQQADRLSRALWVGRAFAERHARAKQDAGFVDYDDLIRTTVTLLQRPGMGEWVRFKLDAATQHILIDEAQDTNADQWAIIKALAEEFFAGLGAAGERVRTLFTVGDYKQAIFGFQGTDPDQFRKAQEHFAEAAAGVEGELLDLSLSLSFRSAQPILDVTDAMIDALGFEALGLDAPVPPHRSKHDTRPGSVLLLPPVMADDGGETDTADEDSGEEEWVGESERLLADRIARQIYHWWKTEPLWLESKSRDFRPADAMILLRSRGELARLIVARLHERGIPVAGLDRLTLGAPIAVKDLLACARFAMQPEDDLTLASLLVSPLIGLTQDQLYDAAKGRKGALWPHLEEGFRAQLMPVLNAADMASPYRFFDQILSGAMQGRKRLLSRLGEEARDPINALLSAALDFEANHPHSLQLFLDWFDSSDTVIKRDAEAEGGGVRVMTAHGAKGLQAPVVILADATRDPTRAPSRELLIPLPDDQGAIPILRPSQEHRTASLAVLDDGETAKELREHRRLLYVALTRAEEHLLIAGALKKGDPHELSWHGSVAQAMDGLAAEALDDPVWGSGVRRHHRVGGERKAMMSAAAEAEIAAPDWLWRDPEPETAPARPLAPSSLGRDDETRAPASAAMEAAAQKGLWLHSLFERLPALPREARAAAAERWLSGSAGIRDVALRQELIATVTTTLDHPDFVDFFTGEALAEAPLAGVVDGFVVAGTVDRLCITDEAVMVIDYKTGRSVPHSADKAPVAHLRQMAAYVAVLRQLFPDKVVRAALLYTAGPVAHVLDDALLARHKPDLAWQQEDYSA